MKKYKVQDEVNTLLIFCWKQTLWKTAILLFISKTLLRVDLYLSLDVRFIVNPLNRIFCN